MTIPPELEAKIVRLHVVEKWPVGTIASQLGVHHSVVERVVAGDGLPKPTHVRRSKLDEFVPFIERVLREHPTICASRLYHMCRERGHEGSERNFRRFVRPLRPKPKAEAYLRLRTLPGEQAQVDWGHFGTVTIGRAIRQLMAFVMVLSYSRRIFLRFFLGQQTENFLRGHEMAFAAWGGVVRVALYDNLKSCVLERYGDVVRFNPFLVAFAAHYHYEPRPVAKARGNEKGRVERAISYVRRSFFAARDWTDLDDLNEQASEWCNGIAMERPWPEDPQKTVAQAFEEERARLLPLPENPFPVHERREVPVGKTPYVRFDRNDYSVPHDYARDTVAVIASLTEVRVVNAAGDVIARHTRSYSKGEQVEDPGHIEGLVQAKRRAREHRGFDRLYRAAPSARALMQGLAERGHNLGVATARLLSLLDEHGARALEDAIREALANDVPHYHAVRHILDRERRRRGDPPRIPVELPQDPRIRDLTVQPHPLESYDELGDIREEDQEETKDD
jgi:transposase